jgi:hypothetical protein
MKQRNRERFSLARSHGSFADSFGARLFAIGAIRVSRTSLVSWFRSLALRTEATQLEQIAANRVNFLSRDRAREINFTHRGNHDALSPHDPLVTSGLEGKSRGNQTQCCLSCVQQDKNGDARN